MGVHKYVNSQPPTPNTQCHKRFVLGRSADVSSLGAAPNPLGVGSWKLGISEAGRTSAERELLAFGELGEPFDPRVHEALMHQHADDIDGPTCTAILQPGYRIGERVIRPARVAVAEPSTDPAGASVDRPGDEAADEPAALVVDDGLTACGAPGALAPERWSAGRGFENRALAPLDERPQPDETRGTQHVLGNRKGTATWQKWLTFAELAGDVRRAGAGRST